MPQTLASDDVSLSYQKMSPTAEQFLTHAQIAVGALRFCPPTSLYFPPQPSQSINRIIAANASTNIPEQPK
ncbi:uncharacterized protein VTP21DRAFT_7509 [Calcarisporiella thermophila]|uniref:uncharacterized protein n=1 Tax=Calcarisporiella thermophila TaxID=911321 RepID=UPI00374280DA